MSEQDVYRIMGKPNTVTSADGKVRWGYIYGDGLGRGRAASFLFENGKVVEVPVVPDSF